MGLRWGAINPSGPCDTTTGVRPSNGLGLVLGSDDSGENQHAPVKVRGLTAEQMERNEHGIAGSAKQPCICYTNVFN